MYSAPPLRRIFTPDSKNEEDEDSEDRKETEQLPLTKDFHVSKHNAQRMAREALTASAAFRLRDQVSIENNSVRESMGLHSEKV